MLKRREFIKISALIAAGSVLPMALWNQTTAVETNFACAAVPSPPFRLIGNKRFGCASTGIMIDHGSNGLEYRNGKRWA